jgi:hypothetical protein
MPDFATVYRDEAEFMICRVHEQAKLRILGGG